MIHISRLLVFLRAISAPVRVSVLVIFAASLADGVLMPFFALWAASEDGVPAAAGLLLGRYAAG